MEIQRGKDSEGSLEDNLDPRSQYTYKVIVIKICGLV